MSQEIRAHALLSASGAHRWLNCPPSALLEDQFSGTTSPAAREGTLAHELAELKVRNYFYSVDFGKRKLTSAVNKLKKQELWQDEMMGYTDDYLDYIKKIALGFQNTPYVAIEKRVDFSHYVPEGFGTADCIMLSGGELHIIDFKYGKSPGGRVSAENNPQMLLYALGAYETYKMLYPITSVKVAIVQPRLSDGISEWSCSQEKLLEFGEYVRQRASLAIKGEGEYNPDPKTCKWCRARANCRVRADENVKQVFHINKKPPLISNDEVGAYLAQGEDVATWLSDLKDYALAQCLAGRAVPGWKAVEGRGGRDWTDMDVAFDTLQKMGVIEGSMLWKREPLTLAQVEKVAGKKDFNDCVGSLVIKTPGKPTLAKETDKREVVTNKISAATAFKEDI